MAKVIPKFKRYDKSLLLVLLLFFVIGLAAYVMYIEVRHNLHVVAPGQVYRSGRMNPKAMAQVVKSLGIRSVLSLVGINDIEKETVHRAGAEYFAFSLSDHHEVSDSQVENIVVVLYHAPKPLLIHCKAGADRAGLVSALYRYAVEAQPASEADGELTFFYGHMPYWLGFPNSAMDRTFWHYVSHHASGSAVSMRQLVHRP